MAEHEITEIRVPVKSGELITIRVREKRRETDERGVDCIVYALINPRSQQEVGEYWAPIAQPPQT